MLHLSNCEAVVLCLSKTPDGLTKSRMADSEADTRTAKLAGRRRNEVEEQAMREERKEDVRSHPAIQSPSQPGSKSKSKAHRSKKMKKPRSKRWLG